MVEMKLAVLLMVCWGALAFGYSFQQEEGDAECDEGYTSIAGACYKFYQTRMSWSEAKGTCKDEAAVLASVESQEEYDGILQHINANYPGTYWTSGKVEVGKWRWSATGNPMNSQWWGREPSLKRNRCAYFCSNTLKYWDKVCSYNLRFICVQIGGPSTEAV